MEDWKALYTDLNQQYEEYKRNSFRGFFMQIFCVWDAILNTKKNRNEQKSGR